MFIAVMIRAVGARTILELFKVYKYFSSHDFFLEQKETYYPFAYLLYCQQLSF